MISIVIIVVSILWILYLLGRVSALKSEVILLRACIKAVKRYGYPAEEKPSENTKSTS